MFIGFYVILKGLKCGPLVENSHYTLYSCLV
jgi:hypothetical protein